MASKRDFFFLNLKKMSQTDLHWIDISSCKSVQGNRLLHNGELMIIIIIIACSWVHSHSRPISAKSKSKSKSHQKRTEKNVLIPTRKGINAVEKHLKINAIL